MIEVAEDKTYGDWFSGFGGMTIGAIEAGFKPVFACEYDEDIADVYRRNLGDHVRVGDLLGMDNGVSHPTMPRSKNARKRRLQDMQGDWLRRAIANGAKHQDFVFETPQFPHVTWKHDSPPCPNFSVAKKDAQEGAREIALAWKCAEYLMYARPKYYSLENVQGYEGSESLGIILRTLGALGYGRSYHVLNSADYGVPQTRRRLILRARVDGIRPRKPDATHQAAKKLAKYQASSLFGDSFLLRPWVGWDEATTDIAHSFPDSEFADWQLRKMPKTILCGSLINHMNAKRAATVLARNEPSMTITGSLASRPSHLSVILMPGSNAGTARAYDSSEPCYTIADTGRSGNAGRVLIEQEGNAHRTAQLTVRALARLQSFPDWYKFPTGTDSYQRKLRSSYMINGEFPATLDRWQSEYLETSRSLSCRGIGNAVPPKLAEAIGKAW